MRKTHGALSALGLSAGSAPRHGPTRSTLTYGGGAHMHDAGRALEGLGYVRRQASGHPRYWKGKNPRYHEYVHPDGHKVVLTKNDDDDGIKSAEAQLQRLVPHGTTPPPEEPTSTTISQPTSTTGAPPPHGGYSDQSRARQAITSAGERGMRHVGDTVRRHNVTVSRYEPNTDQWMGHRPRREQLHNRMGIVGYDLHSDDGTIARYDHPEGHRVTMQHDGEHVNVVEHRHYHASRPVGGTVGPAPRSRTTGPARDTRGRRR